MGTKNAELVKACPAWPRQHFHEVFNDSAPNSPDVETCELTKRCNCCGKESLLLLEPWNNPRLPHLQSYLCAGCHWDKSNGFDACKHSGTEESYLAYIRGKAHPA